MPSAVTPSSSIGRFSRLTQKVVYPRGLAAGGIPAPKRAEGDLLEAEAEGIDPHLIRAGVGLVGPDPIGAQPLIDQAFEPGVRDGGVEHPRIHVGQEPQPDTCVPQGREGGPGVRIRGEVQVGVHQLTAPLLREIHLHHPGGEDQGLVRHRPEVRVAAHQGAQPGVFELSGTPDGSQLSAFAGKEPFSQREHRPGIEGGEGVECEGLDPGLPARQPGLRPDSQGTEAGEAEELPSRSHHTRLLADPSREGRTQSRGNSIRGIMATSYGREGRRVTPAYSPPWMRPNPCEVRSPAPPTHLPRIRTCRRDIQQPDPGTGVGSAVRGRPVRRPEHTGLTEPITVDAIARRPPASVPLYRDRRPG